MVYERRFGMQISWEWYRVFYYAARYGNFSRAAEVMLSDQPNVTRTVRNLEAALGCQLFVRSNRGCTLTPEGAKLFSAVEAAHERIEDGEYELSRDRSLEAGVITVGASETALHELLIDAIRRFHSHYPGIRVRIFNHSTPQAVAALHDGLVDLAVVSTPTAVRPPITERGLAVFRECAVAGAQLSDLRGRTLSLSELSQYPLIMLGRGTMTYEFYTELFSRSGVELRADIEGRDDRSGAADGSRRAWDRISAGVLCPAGDSVGRCVRAEALVYDTRAEDMSFETLGHAAVNRGEGTRKATRRRQRSASRRVIFFTV